MWSTVWRTRRTGYNSSPPEKLPKPNREYVVFQASLIVGANMLNFGEGNILLFFVKVMFYGFDPPGIHHYSEYVLFFPTTVSKQI